MKKVFFAFAIAGMFAFAACGEGAATDTTAVADTNNVEAQAPETTDVAVDTTAQVADTTVQNA